MFHINCFKHTVSFLLFKKLITNCTNNICKYMCMTSHLYTNVTEDKILVTNTTQKVLSYT